MSSFPEEALSSPPHSEGKIREDSIPAYEHEYIIWNYEQRQPSILDPVRWYFTGFKRRVVNYLISTFPILQWIHRYNLKWLWGDVVAGITVGIVVVPQGMSYASVAGLPVQYGLYSSFIGVMLYCFFATSKDISIGPVAVMSAETATIVKRVLSKDHSLTEADAPYIAATLCLLVGGITFGFGLLRLGFLLEYIPMPAVMGFMTGSAFTIAVGQVPNLMGIKKYSGSSGASYEVVIHILQNLHHSDYNAAFGVLSLFVLYAMKWTCGYLEKRDKKRKWVWFYLNTMRSALVIIFTTLISWGCARIHGKNDGIQRIGTVPRGLHNVGIHKVDSRVASALAPDLPIATVVLVLEHIAIAKSFGRINEYRINPNQELIAIGFSNLIGQFFMSYPNTGSFSRTALKSKCGVRTPLAGLLTGVCVLIAIYALTEAFYYISKAALSAIIIHAVLDLIASWQSTYKFFRVSPVECLIFIVDVFLCVFVTLEAGIYFSFAASLVFVLLRQTFPLGEFLGKVEFTRHVSDEIPEGEDLDEEEPTEKPKLGAIQQGIHNSVAFVRGTQHIAKEGASLVKAGAKGSATWAKEGVASAKTSVSRAKDGTAQFARDAAAAPGKYFRKEDRFWNKASNKTTEVDEEVDKKNGEPEVQSVSYDSSNSLSGFEEVLEEGLPMDDGEVQLVRHFDNILLPSGDAEPEKPLTKPVIHPGNNAAVTKWWPLSHNNIHPGIRVVPPPPGILVYRFREALTYQNVAWQTERIVDYVREHTRRDIDIATLQHQKLGDRPWNEPGPRKYVPPKEEDKRPVLRAIIFDMSCSPHVDLTGAQGLWDCHQEVTKYASVPVEFHFAGILTQWAQRALVQSGFGNQNGKVPPHSHRLIELAPVDDPEAQYTEGLRADFAPVVDTAQCYFHFDIPDLSFR